MVNTEEKDDASASNLSPRNNDSSKTVLDENVRMEEMVGDDPSKEEGKHTENVVVENENDDKNVLEEQGAEEMQKDDKVETDLGEKTKRPRKRGRNKLARGRLRNNAARNEDAPKSIKNKKLAGGSSEKVIVGNDDEQKSSKKEVGQSSSERANVKNTTKPDSKKRKVDGAVQNEDKPESTKMNRAKKNSKKKESKKVESMGMIFMCSSKTKKDCYHYKVLGLPANKRDVVQKVYKGMRLFLYDFDLRLLYGIYKAAGPGGYNIEPKAFKSQFPSQVRFSMLEDCLPLAEEKFKKVIKDNYYTNTKFDCLLNSEQVKKLCKLFTAGRKSSSRRMGRSPVAKSREEMHSGLGRMHLYREHPVTYERQIREAPPTRALPVQSLAPPPSFANGNSLEVSSYGQGLYLEHPNNYKQDPISELHDPYSRNRLADHRDPYRQDYLVEHPDAYRQEYFVERREPYRPEHHSLRSRDLLLESRGSYRRDSLLEHGDLYRQEGHDLLPRVMEPVHHNEIRSDAPILYRELPTYRNDLHSRGSQLDYYSPARVLPEYRPGSVSEYAVTPRVYQSVRPYY